MTKQERQLLGMCKGCGRKLLLNRQGVCVHCELDALRRRVAELELMLAESRRERSRLHRALLADGRQEAEQETWNKATTGAMCAPHVERPQPMC